MTLLVSGLFFICMLMLSLYSIHFGVNAYDEAFYIALPYHFILSGKPFIDEYAIAQTASLFTYPFFKLFYLFKTNTDGIVLFSRYLYSIISFLFSILIYFVLRNSVEKTALIIISTLCFVFVPFNIHGLSYNTLGMIFLSISLFLNFSAAQKLSSHTIFFAALFLVFTSIAYPPFVFITPLIILSLWGFLFYRNPNAIRKLKIYLLGLVLGSFWFLWLLFQAGFDQILKIIVFQSSTGVQAEGFAKLLTISKQFSVISYKYNLILLGVFLALLLIKYKLKTVAEKNKLRSLLLFLLPLVLIVSLSRPMLSITYLAMLGICLYPFIKHQKNNKDLFYLVYLPSLAAGILSSWASSNGIVNAAIGLFPAALVSLCFISSLFSQIQNSFASEKIKRGLLVLKLLSLSAIIFTIQLSNLNHFYADLPRAQLISKISTGIFSGIYTTEAKKAFYLQLANDIKAYGRQKGSVLFFDDFPAGYLMTSLKPATNTVWLISSLAFPSIDRAAILDYFDRRGRPNFVVQMLNVPENPNPGIYQYRYLTNDAILKYLKDYHQNLTRPAYKFYLSPE